MEWLLKTPVAHRGLHDETRPENSMAAFKAAIEKGYNIEIDLRLTKDGIPVVFHDSNLLRVCGVKKSINKMKLDEVKKYRLKGTEEQIPTFDEFLSLVDGKVGLLIELKGFSIRDHSLEIATLERLKNYKGNFAIQSFNPWAVKYCKENSSYKCGLLATYAKRFMAPSGKLTWVKLCNPDFVAYDIRQAENKYVEKIHKTLPLLCWTIRTEDDLKKAQSIADNIIFEKVEPNFIYKS